MKLTKKQLIYLIESVLKEDKTDPGDGSSKKELEGEKTEMGDTFMTNQMMPHGGKQPMSHEKRIQAITDFRKGSDRGQFPPMTFGPGIDDEGNLESGAFTTVHDYHEPDPYDQAAVRRYKKQHYLGPTDVSVDDPEVTRIGLEDDENTEESPFGTQYSMDATKTQYRFDDKTADDDGFTAHSGDDIYLGPEDEEGYIPPEDYSEDDTQYDVDQEENVGFFANLKNKIINMLKEEKNITRSMIRKAIIAEIKRVSYNNF